MILRPRQVTFVKNCLAALKKHGNTLGVANTGFGKTIALSAVVGERINCDRRALIVAHRDELTSQNEATFKKVCPDLTTSLYNADEKSWRGRVTFSMIQTLSRDEHLAKMPPVDLLVYDEAHHAAANGYKKLTARARELNPKVEILGVTATPERTDKKGLLSVFTNVADIVTIGEMVRAGHLVPPRAMVIDIGTQEELKKVRRTATDFDQAEVEAIQNTTVHNNQVVSHWQEQAAGRSSVAFCSTIQHAEDVAAAFQEMNIEARAVHSEMPMKERRAILAAFDHGEIPVLTNPMILTEGWDSPRASCIMLLRPASHKSTMIQMVGRGLRKIDPAQYGNLIKKDCIVLDFGISLLLHGDLNAEVKLHDRKVEKEEEEKFKKCPKCSSFIPYRVRVCPLCGYEYRTMAEEEGVEGYDEEKELKLIEIDLLNNSPFRWVNLFGTENIMVATGFDAWASVCSPDGENFFAIGGKANKATLLGVADKIGAIGSADDFMRANETNASAKKKSRWMFDPATEKQMRLLGWSDARLTKVEAAAYITFNFNKLNIENLIGVR